MDLIQILLQKMEKKMKKYLKIKNFNRFFIEFCIYNIENYENNPWDESPKNRKIWNYLELNGTKWDFFGTFLCSKYNSIVSFLYVFTIQAINTM